jgi:hypothetical protein
LEYYNVIQRFDQPNEAKATLRQALDEAPTQSYLWNRYARLLSGSEQSSCLEQCAFAFFELSDTIPQHPDSQHELAKLLYKKLLGLELPYAIQLPKERAEIALCKMDVFLWLNYLSLLVIRGSIVEFEEVLPLALERVGVESKPVIRIE